MTHFTTHNTVRLLARDPVWLSVAMVTPQVVVFSRVDATVVEHFTVHNVRQSTALRRNGRRLVTFMKTIAQVIYGKYFCAIKTCKFSENHRLRCSASIVLTATAWRSQKNGKIWPLTDSKPLGRLPKKLSQMIGSAKRPAVPNLVEIGSRGSSGEMGVFSNYHSFLYTHYIYKYLFSSPSLQVRPLNGSWRTIYQNARNHATSYTGSPKIGTVVLNATIFVLLNFKKY